MPAAAGLFSREKAVAAAGNCYPHAAVAVQVAQGRTTIYRLGASQSERIVCLMEFLDEVFA